ncbi:MAG: endonuclease Q family protein [Patescibacteria group bacterium]
MRVIADLHIHSAYSRGCSRDLTLENIDSWCQYKGIKIVSTGDFTHPKWFKEIKDKLIEAEPGLYRLKDSDSLVRFVLGTEISCIYSQGGKTRRIHVCLLVPDITTVEKIIADFEKRGFNIKSDGRPIIGLSAKELAKIILNINQQSLVVPAHAWTPWFAVFGSKSGFDSLAECFEEITPYIHAIETGLSSDPKMNWQLSALDRITLLSNSDAHSPANLGREANVFEITDGQLSYQEISRLIKEKDKNKFLYTIEFFPEEGKYHFDGHAACRYLSSPAVSKKNNNLCPLCKKPLTLGVLHRVNELADQKNSDSPKNIPYKSLIPLQEIIADSFGVGKNSKKVQTEYFNLIKKYCEFEILIDLTEEQLKKIARPEIAERIISVRLGRVEITPGYDGIYGQIAIKTAAVKTVQKKLL